MNIFVLSFKMHLISCMLLCALCSLCNEHKLNIYIYKKEKIAIHLQICPNCKSPQPTKISKLLSQSLSLGDWIIYGYYKRIHCIPNWMTA